MQKRDAIPLLLGLAGLGLWLYFQRPAGPASGYAATIPYRDAGWNYPAIYPNVTGSPAVDPIATWPGWVGTPPYAPWPGMEGDPGILVQY